MTPYISATQISHFLHLHYQTSKVFRSFFYVSFTISYSSTNPQRPEIFAYEELNVRVFLDLSVSSPGNDSIHPQAQRNGPALAQGCNIRQVRRKCLRGCEEFVIQDLVGSVYDPGNTQAEPGKENLRQRQDDDCSYTGRRPRWPFIDINRPRAFHMSITMSPFSLRGPNLAPTWRYGDPYGSHQLAVMMKIPNRRETFWFPRMPTCCWTSKCEQPLMIPLNAGGADLSVEEAFMQEVYMSRTLSVRWERRKNRSSNRASIEETSKSR